MKSIFTKMLGLTAYLISSIILAQELPEVIPPSPEATSLGKFTEVPISHYTGVPNISVPITSFTVGDKIFPVSLNYHARGIQVSEIASRVGLGWALNAGGQITRQVRDKADFLSGTNRMLMQALGSDVSSENFFTSQSVRNNYSIQDSNLEFQPDRIPDQFNLQVGGLSVKFIIDYKTNEALVQKYDDIKISFNTGVNGINDFTVIDKEGYVYYFNVANKDDTFISYVFPIQGSYSQFPSTRLPSYNTWLLTKIVSPNNDIADLDYDEEITFSHIRSYDEEENDQVISHASKIRRHQYQLKEIRYNYSQSSPLNYNKIVFTALNDRLDVKSGAKELDVIEIYNKNELIKSYNFYQSYITSDDDDNQNYYLKTWEPESNRRLFLDSILESGYNGLAKPPYVFSYNSQKLPNRFSNSQDLWGYYNGADNGRFLLFMNGATGAINRTVDLSKSAAGLLERIKYPTGGSTKFTYEHNRGIKGMAYDNIAFPLVNPVTRRDTIISHFDTSVYDGSKYVKEISIGTLLGPLKTQVHLPDWLDDNQTIACDNPHNNCQFPIRLEAINGTPGYQSKTIYAGNHEYYIDPGDYELIVNTPNGWNPNPSSDPDSTNNFFTVSLVWDEQIIDEDELLYGAGKRIKQIEFLDSSDHIVSKKIYEYKTPQGNESGHIFGIPYFNSLHPNILLGDFNVYEVSSAIPGSPFSTYQSNTVGYEYVTEFNGDMQGNIGKTQYNFTVQGDTGAYTSYPITPPTDNEWLRGLPKFIKYYKRNTNNSYSLVKETKYDYLYGNQSSPFSFIPSSVSLDLDNNATEEPDYPLGILYDKTRTMYRLPLVHLFFPYDENGSTVPNDLHYKIYHLTGGTIDTFKTTETLYDQNGVSTLVKTKINAFNYDNHYQTTAVTTVTSDGKPIMQTMTYPQDLVSGYTVHPNTYSSVSITALAEQHRFVPLETKTYKDLNNDGYIGFPPNEDILNTTITEYAWDYNMQIDDNDDVLEPSLIKTAKGNAALETRIEFKDYDSKGNILQVSKVNGANIAYIYGYNDTQPIAKIENASYDDLDEAQESAIDAIKLASNSDVDTCIGITGCSEANLRDALNTLRDVFPKSMVTTYTYNPLVGVTSITDPRGQTVYYKYDEFNRLKHVKDKDGNILSENLYNYSTDE